MAKRFLKIIGSLFLIGVMGPVVGGDDVARLRGEREVLARIAQELDYLKTLADEAQRERASPGRLQFQYDWFRRDLEHVKQGILDYLHGPNHTPIEVPPLRGDYRR